MQNIAVYFYELKTFFLDEINNQIQFTRILSYV
jgi:hypothetical protein